VAARKLPSRFPLRPVPAPCWKARARLSGLVGGPAAALCIALTVTSAWAFPLDDSSAVGEALARVFRQVQPSVVQVIAYRPVGPSVRASEGLGRLSRLEPPRRTFWASGIVMNGQGFVLTCSGAAQPSDSLEIRRSDGKRYGARFLAQDPVFGVSLLVARDPDGLVPMRAQRQASERDGDWLLVLSFAPRTGEPRLKLATLGTSRGSAAGAAAYFRINLADCQGTCGGAVVDGAGRLRGMVVDTSVEEEQALARGSPDPADLLDCESAWALCCTKLDSLSARLLLRSRQPIGFLGVRAEVGDDMPRAGSVRSVNAPEGLLRVVKVIPGSPAEQVGIQPDDQILEINGQPVTTSAEILNVVASSRPGTELTVKVLRRGIPLVFSPRVGDRSALDWIDREDRQNQLRRKRISIWIQQLQQRLQQIEQQKSPLE
jgi:serine protease DegS